MANHWKLVLLFTLLLSQLYQIATIDDPEGKKAEAQSPIPIKYFTPELMTPIFEVMRSYGVAERQKNNIKK